LKPVPKDPRKLNFSISALGLDIEISFHTRALEIVRSWSRLRRDRNYWQAERIA